MSQKGERKMRPYFDLRSRGLIWAALAFLAVPSSHAQDKADPKLDNTTGEKRWSQFLTGPNAGTTLADAGPGELEVIRLKNANAVEVAKILDEAFNGKGGGQKQGGGGGGAPRAEVIRVVADPATNSLLVRASPLNLLAIRAMISRNIDADTSTYMVIRDPQQDLLGATFTPLSDALRAQLNVPAGQGILVELLRSDGPSAQAGLKVHDVLLTLAEKPLTSADDLAKNLKAAGEAPVTLKLLRAGSKVSLQIRPVYHVTFGPVGTAKKEYFIGISLNDLDEALRSQLKLPAGQGVIINEVIKNSPAEKAGIKAHDVVLELGGKLIDTPDKLAAQVQVGQEKPQLIKLLRAGKPLSIYVEAAMRNVESTEGFQNPDVYLRTFNALDSPLDAVRRVEALKDVLIRQRQNEKDDGSAHKIEELQRQVQSLRQAIDQLNMLLKSNPPSKK
jgi:membrane-associated protease RseP (regulator of RpoE activity)